MMIIGESGDIGQLQWYVFYSTLITRFAQSLLALHFHCIAVLPAIRFEDIAP